jgi:ribonuclease III
MIPSFKDKKLFEQAFIHRSYLNEVKENLSSNERLEFLGDAVLSFVVSRDLYKKYPNFEEGILTNLRSLLVNTKSLAEAARELNFGQYLKLSRGEEDSKGRENQSLLADCFEAFVGALFLDQGIEAAAEFLSQTLIQKTEALVQKRSFKDPKSLLQEAVQAKRQNSPVYKVISEEGPPHAKIFTIGAYVNKELLGTGKGKSKQDAEEKAAIQALESIRK